MSQKKSENVIACVSFRRFPYKMKSVDRMTDSGLITLAGETGRSGLCRRKLETAFADFLWVLWVFPSKWRDRKS